MSILLFFLLSMLLPFVGVVALSTLLLMICGTRRRLIAAACFIISALVVPGVLFSLGASSGVLRYSAQGPILWLAVWPAFGFACLGIIGAGFAVTAIRRRLIRSTSNLSSTRTI